MQVFAKQKAFLKILSLETELKWKESSSYLQFVCYSNRYDHLQLHLPPTLLPRKKIQDLMKKSFQDQPKHHL